MERRLALRCHQSLLAVANQSDSLGQAIKISTGSRLRSGKKNYNSLPSHSGHLLSCQRYPLDAPRGVEPLRVEEATANEEFLLRQTL